MGPLGGIRFRCGEGNGTPLQCSCLENPMDGGPWYAAVHGVAKSRTRLSDFPFTFHVHALEKEMAAHSSVLAWRIPGTGEPGGLPSMGLQNQTRLKRLSSSSRFRWGQECGALMVESVFSKEAMPESLYSCLSHHPPPCLHEDTVRRQLPASQKENLPRILPCWYPDLRITAYRTVRKQLSVG